MPVDSDLRLSSEAPRPSALSALPGGHNHAGAAPLPVKQSSPFDTAGYRTPAAVEPFEVIHERRAPASEPGTDFPNPTEERSPCE